MSLLFCDHFKDDSCCSSCHEDAEQGWHDLPEVYRDDGSLFAIVCCGKYEEAKKQAEALG